MNLPYSAEQIEEIKEDLYNKAKEIRTRELPSDMSHQLCFLHMQRNIKKNMSKQDAKQFYEELSLIKKIKDYEKAIVKFEDLCKSYEKRDFSLKLCKTL
jgi:transposase-like protein